MFKRSIKTFILCFVLSLMCVLSVNAASLESIVEPGDIIIGNTVFRSDDWISASRSSKAGALYAMNTGETEVRVFYYDDFEDWYEYNDTTSKYELITEPTLSELGDVIDIYYDNNEPLTNTYEAYVEYEYDEENDEEYVLDANDVYWLYNEVFGEIFLDDENVELDYEKETITCPYNYVFDFQVVANNEAENFKGICGIEDLDIVYEEEYNLEEISIESIELTSSTDYPEFLNQDKVEFSDGYIKVLEELEDISYGSQEYRPISLEGKYIAFDIHFSENNNAHYYSLMERYSYGIEKNYYYDIIDNNTLRLYLLIETYGYTSFNFLLIDNMFNKYENLSFYANGLEKPSYDFSLENVSGSSFAFDEEMGNNNANIHSVEVIESEESHYYDTIRVNTIGDLSESSFNDYPAKWIAIDLFFNEDVDYDYIDITFNGEFDANYDYEFLDDRIKLYVVYDNYGWLPFTIRDKRTETSLYYTIVVNNYSKDNYVTLDNGFKGVYTTNGSEGFVKVDTNYSSYYDVLYDEVNSKLYYTNPHDILFMDNDSLKMLTTKYDNDGEEVIVKDVELFIKYNHLKYEEENYHYESPAALDDYDSLYEHVLYRFENEAEETTVTIYTFFNRELTEEEQAEFAKFEDLINEGKVEIVDISSSIYE